jgi:hypothetical protein
MLRPVSHPAQPGIRLNRGASDPYQSHHQPGSCWTYGRSGLGGDRTTAVLSANGAGNYTG